MKIFAYQRGLVPAATFFAGSRSTGWRWGRSPSVMASGGAADRAVSERSAASGCAAGGLIAGGVRRGLLAIGGRHAGGGRPWRGFGCE